MVGLSVASIVFQVGSISGIVLAIISILLQIWAILIVCGAVKEIDILKADWSYENNNKV